MTLNQAFFDTWTPRVLALLRIVTAFLFLQHGTAKLLHVPHVAMFDNLPVLSFIGFAGLLEFVGGVLLILGLYTRPTAFILSGEMAVAISSAMRHGAMFCRRCLTRANPPSSTVSSSCCCRWPVRAPGASARLVVGPPHPTAIAPSPGCRHEACEPAHLFHLPWRRSWPYLEDFREVFRALEASLKDMPRQIGVTPKTVLVISGHWEERDFTVMASPNPPMVYDYSGFPEHTYRVTYGALGSPELARRVQALIRAAGLAAHLDPRRGFDHGAFVPLAILYPDAHVPVVQLSLKAGYDPAEHLAVGRALAPLRGDGVLIVGSGLSYHNMRQMGPGAKAASKTFDAWLQDTFVEANPAERTKRLLNWSRAPAARQAHPQEDHLIHLMVAVGAAKTRRRLSSITRKTCSAVSPRRASGSVRLPCNPARVGSQRIKTGTSILPVGRGREAGKARSRRPVMTLVKPKATSGRKAPSHQWSVTEDET